MTDTTSIFDFNTSKPDVKPSKTPVTSPKPTVNNEKSALIDQKPVVKAQKAPVKEVKTVFKDPTGQFDYTGCQTHKVQAGETLLDIAQQYTVAIQQLRYFNHIDRHTFKIRTGQVLAIPSEPVHVPYKA